MFDDDVDDEGDFDPFSADEFWRAANPGFSVARGVLVAVAVSVVFWASILGLGWLITH